MPMIDIRVAAQAFDPANELTRFTAGAPASGAIVSFLGKVRGDAGTLALDIRHYPPMTLAGFGALGDSAVQRWPVEALMIVHRVGEMAPDAPIVLVAAAARHRRDAFAATDFVMDHLKSDSWLWKRERTVAGWRWIEPRAADHDDRARWR